ncbi:wax ester/triacylglycerol synthase family O-acyltransferase [Smaragdicoccus niigatensis]|uniref:wax ester/triacylglycerol synthase family O-acyltransferase n=1 Tax=Smaragdicoccus niigatensis TaxID=359359 RepID=UPI00037B48D4|nr:wax ester/triacylglycerol synthase family O-acyltransferase [Smaragdicoccus niigatensis]
MTLKSVTPLDAAFMLVDRDEMPWHIAVMMVYTLPDDAGDDFVADLRDQMREQTVPASPYNLKPAFPSLRQFPLMREVSEIDVDHHVRLHQISRPGGERELNVLVGEIHDQSLDPNHPLWELHLIDGLAERQFAVFFKVHHSVLDGVTGMRRLLRWLSPDPAARNRPAMYTVGPESRPPSPRRAALTGAVKASARTAYELTRTVLELARGSFDGNALASPYSSPKTMWHGRVSHGRSISYCQFGIADLKAVAADFDCTVSDLVLYLCGSGLRSYLLDRDALPEAPLTAGAPFNIRGEDDERPGSAFAFLTVDLATEIANAEERLDAVAASNSASKAQLSRLSEGALSLQTFVANGPMIATMALGFGAFVPAAFGVVVSNVPGPREQLYLNGARLDALIPISIPMHNSPMNMTCIGHGDQMTFGVAAATNRVPGVHRITDGIVEALGELQRIGARRRMRAV